MSDRYQAEPAEASGVIGTAWDVVDTYTDEFVGFIHWSTATDIAQDLNDGVVERDVYWWSAS